MFSLPLDFQRPDRLWWLLLIPALVGLYLWLTWRQGRPARPGRSSLDLVIPRQAAWKRHLAVGAAIASLGTLIVAFAVPLGYTEVPRDRATVVVAIDVSRSMVATDVQPTRLDGAKSAAKDFLGMLPSSFNVALVAFAGTASLVVPPTTDRGVLARAIDTLQLAPSTAIGEGIYTSLDALALVPPDPDRPNDPAPAAIVLLSDGGSNLGRSSTDAALAAKAMRTPVYTIAYGTPGGYVLDQGQRVPVPVNNLELQLIASLSGGQKFNAQSGSELKAVYQGLARTIGYQRVSAEVSEQYAGYAFVLAVIAALGVISLGARWP